MKEVIVACDRYKLSHHFQYLKGIENLSKNFNHIWFTNSYKDWKKDWKKDWEGQPTPFPENVTQIDVV